MPTIADLWLAMQKARLVNNPVYWSLVRAVSEPCDHSNCYWIDKFVTTQCLDCEAVWDVVTNSPNERKPRVYPDVPGPVSGAIGVAIEDMLEAHQLPKVTQALFIQALAFAKSFDDQATLAACLKAIEESTHDA